MSWKKKKWEKIISGARKNKKNRVCKQWEPILYDIKYI